MNEITGSAATEQGTQSVNSSDMLEIPDNVLICCPKVQFNLARVSACATCESFKGLIDRFQNSEVPFARRYLLKCSEEPVKRPLSELTE